MTPIERLALEKRVDALLADVHGKPVPGCAVGVARHGEVLLAKGYGMASIEHGVAVRADTVFRIASVTKQFTVVAALMLAAEGRLSLGDDVRVHVPELPPLPWPVTLDHLMRNTSGLPDMLELIRLGGAGMDQGLSRARLLAAIARCRHQNFEPGSRFLYSNSNFLLLGLVVERISGQSLNDFLQARLLRPLGMSDTALVPAADAVLPRLASPYLPAADGGFKRAAFGLEHGGEGGLVSTVQDLLLWGDHLDRSRVAGEGLFSQLAEPTLLRGGAPSAYSRGVEHGRYRGVATIGHGGLWPGYRTEFLRIPDACLTVAVIANFAAAEPYRLAREVAVAALQGESRFEPEAPAPAAEALAAMVGTWCCEDEPALLTLNLQRGELVATQWGTSFMLHAEADGSFTALRGAYEFGLRRASEDALELAVGAGRWIRLRRLAERAGVPADLAGQYRCDDVAAEWTLATGHEGGDWHASVRGPIVSEGGPWAVRGVSGDLIELVGEGAWLAFSPLARVERDAAGRITGLRVDSGRVKGLRFARV